MNSGIAGFFLNNPLTLFNSILLVVTGYLSYSTFKFQRRTSAREAIEQLEDVHFYRGKITPILSEYNFRPIFGNSFSVVKLKYYKYGKNPASANQETDLFSETLNTINSGAGDENLNNSNLYFLISEALESQPGVEMVTADENGIYAQFQTANAVQIRRKTEFILRVLSDAHTVNEQNLRTALEEESANPTEPDGSLIG